MTKVFELASKVVSTLDGADTDVKVQVIKVVMAAIEAEQQQAAQQMMLRKLMNEHAH